MKARVTAVVVRYSDERKNWMCDLDGPVSFIDVLKQGHLTEPFVK